VITMYAGRLDVPANVFVYSLGKEHGRSRVRKVVAFYRLVLTIIRREQLDVSFAHMTPLLAALFFPIAKIRKIPILLWYAHKSVPVTLRIAHPLVDRCLASTPEGFRLQSRKVFFVGQGINTATFTPPAKIPPGYESTWLSVGRIAPIKQVHEMIAAVALVRDSGIDVQLVLAGGELTARDRAYRRSLRQLCCELGLDGAIHFQGAVSFRDIPNWYRRAGFFLSLSESGSLDKTILESMASGCIPVSRNEAFQDLALRHGLGELVPGPGPQGAAECMAALVNDTDAERRRHLRRRLRAIVVAEHGLDSLADQVVDHLREIQRARSSD
jgi:glycosyltransferase involved in cell wall biosynthesis